MQKPSKKMFQCLRWLRKNFILGNFSWSVAAETWDASRFRKALLEKQQCSKLLCHIAIVKNILSELNRCNFQIPLKYIKLVIPKILFILVLYSLRDPSTNYPPKIKISDTSPPPAKTFLKFLTDPSPKLEEGCMPWKLN